MPLTHHSPTQPCVAVVIPCYRVTRHILGVLQAIGSEVRHIIVVDDCCPDGSGDLVAQHCHDPRVTILRNARNEGVGGAVLQGYQQALDSGCGIIIKLDGDGQMDPGLIPDFIAPLAAGDADYAKGNRFYEPEMLREMPGLRLFGSAILSFMTKLSSGYWDLFDPTNGYTAIHRDALVLLPLDKLSRRYFFETDMLFRLNIIRAVVVDVPMRAVYNDEVSNLKIRRIAGEFLVKHLRNFGKRIFYNYYLRDMSLASVELPLGLLMLLFGGSFGLFQWIDSARSGVPASTGTVMLAALPVLMGLQFVLAFLSHDIASTPRRVLQRRHRRG